MRRTLRRCSVETEATIGASLFRMAALYHNIVAENAQIPILSGTWPNRREQPAPHDAAFLFRVTKVTER